MQLSAFDQLQVSITAEDEEIKSAYLALLRDNSPDKNPQSFEIIRQAYEKIATKENRLNYIFFESPVLGLHDVIDRLMETEATEEKTIKAELLLQLVKESLYAN